MHLEDLTHRLIVLFAAALAAIAGLSVTLFLQLPLPLFIHLTDLGDWWTALPMWIPFLLQTLQMICWFALSIYLLKRFSKARPIQEIRRAAAGGMAAGTFLFSAAFLAVAIGSLIQSWII